MTLMATLLSNPASYLGGSEVVIEAGEIARNSVVKILGTLFLERRANAEKLVRDAFDTSRIPVCLLNLRPTLGL
jgi:hypothetical protein